MGNIFHKEEIRKQKKNIVAIIIALVFYLLDL